MGGFSDSDVGAGGKSSSFAEQYNTRRASHLSSLQQKEEDMRQKFVIRVEEKERVEEQRRILEENIADFQRRKAQFEAEKMNSGHHTLTLGKLGKKNFNFLPEISAK